MPLLPSPISSVAYRDCRLGIIVFDCASALGLDRQILRPVGLKVSGVNVSSGSNMTSLLMATAIFPLRTAGGNRQHAAGGRVIARRGGGPVGGCIIYRHVLKTQS